VGRFCDDRVALTRIRVRILLEYQMGDIPCLEELGEKRLRGFS
jgi:hypothetical protein